MNLFEPLKTKTEKVGKNNIVYRSMGAGQPVLLLHGFATPPVFYEPLIRALSKDARKVIAPRLFGINYLKNQPTTITQYTEIVNELVAKWQPELVIGHSYGANVGAIQEGNTTTPLVMMNPILPTPYNPKGFTYRAIQKTFREAKEDFGSRSKKIALQRAPQFIINHVKKPIAAKKTIEDLCKFSFDKEVNRETVLLEGTNDLYFTWSFDNKIELLKHFKNITIEEIEGFPHDWPLFYPGMAKGYVNKHFPNPHFKAED